MSIEEKREVVAELHAQEGYSVQMLCGLSGLSRSSYYYQAKSKDEIELVSAIETIGGQYPTYGTRRITRQLRRAPHHLHVNRKRIQRIMRRLGLLRPQKQRKMHTTDSQHGFQRYANLIKGLEVTRPDQVWVSDITYVRLRQGFVYLTVIMDVFTRAIRGWNLSRRLDQELTLKALRQALARHCPEIHHSDQGVHYANPAFVDLLKVHEVRISMAAVGKPEENGYAERLIRTIKEEEVYLSEYRDYLEAHSQIEHFIEDVYQTKRIHSALGYLTPVEFEAQWQEAPQDERSPLILA